VLLRRGIRCCRNRVKCRGGVIKSRHEACQKIQRGAGECAGGWCAKAVGAISNKIARKIIGSRLGLLAVE